VVRAPAIGAGYESVFSGHVRYIFSNLYEEDNEEGFANIVLLHLKVCKIRLKRLLLRFGRSEPRRRALRCGGRLLSTRDYSCLY